MRGRPCILPLEGVSFEALSSLLSTQPHFAAIRDSRYSILAANPSRTFKFTGGFINVDGHTVIDSPAKALASFLDIPLSWQSDSYLPFCGGAVGYITFEAARVLRGVEPAKGFSRFPQCYFGIYPSVVIYDHTENTARIVGNGQDEDECYRWAKEEIEGLNNNPSFVRRDWGDRSLSTPSNSPLQRGRIEITPSANHLLRSDIVTRLHLSATAKSVAPSARAIELFIDFQNSETCCAYFINEDAAAIITTDKNVFTAGADCNQRVKKLIETLPSPKFVGEPFDKAMSFIVNNEPHHRTFYGGAVGLVDSSRFIFRSINHTRNFADGAVEEIFGEDVG